MDVIISYGRLLGGIVFTIPAALCCIMAVAAPDPLVPAAKMSQVKFVIAPPPRPIRDVRAYGAAGDGKTYDTIAIQKAIDACAGTGGSVLLSKGTFLTAQLRLKGGMTFYVGRDAVLLGGTRAEDYPILVPEDTRGTVAYAIRRSVLYADKVEGLILDGGGVIDGQGKFVKMDGHESERPSLLRIFHGANIAVRNLTFRNPRMWTQVYDHCSRLTIENVQVFAPPVCENLDGMDICDCSDVLIRNCRVESEDDGICLKSHGLKGLSNITIRNNTIRSFHANAIKIGTASRGPIENIRILDNTVTGARYGGLCIESVDGSAVRNVIVRGLDLYRTAQPIFIRLGKRSRAPGSIDEVVLENIRVLATHGQTAPSCTIAGISTAAIGAIRLENLYVEMPGGRRSVPDRPPERDADYPQSNIFGDTPAYGFYVRYARGIVFKNVSIGFLKPDVRPWLVSADAVVQAVGCKDLRKINSVKIAGE